MSIVGSLNLEMAAEAICQKGIKVKCYILKNAFLIEPDYS